jgi:hypothetical protein
MAKSYFQVGAEMCYPLKYHFQYMKENDIKEMEVFKAEIEHGTGYFFCHEFDKIGEVNEECGKYCGKYSPRNGKNGRCRFSGYVYTPGKSKILKI